MKYRKLPVVIDAIQYSEKNGPEIVEWSEHNIKEISYTNPDIYKSLQIKTPEGIMSGVKGDYIIRGVNGEYYPCKPDIFEKTYEKVED